MVERAIVVAALCVGITQVALLAWVLFTVREVPDPVPERVEVSV